MAPWFQEEVRRELEKRFGAEQVHEAGLKVETTLDLDLQQTANRAVADGLAAYERRRGWNGKLENVLAGGSTIEDYKHPDWAMKIRARRLCSCRGDPRAAAGDSRPRGRQDEDCASARGLEVDRPALRRRAGQARRHDLRPSGDAMEGSGAPRHAGAGLRRRRAL